MSKKRSPGSPTWPKKDSEMPLFASAQKAQSLSDDLAHIEGRAAYLSTGLRPLDRRLGGGFQTGKLTVVAARIDVGGAALMLGGALAQMNQQRPVAWLSERRTEEQMRGRLVVLQARVNAHRFAAGFVSAEDRIALATAREKLPWKLLHVIAKKRIKIADLDPMIFSYRPWLVLAEFPPRGTTPQQSTRAQATRMGLEQLSSLARKHRVAIVVRMLLPLGVKVPTIESLPGGRANVPDDVGVLVMHRLPSDEPESQLELQWHESAADEGKNFKLVFDARFGGVIAPKSPRKKKR